MAPESLTFTEGANATVPDATSVVVESTNQGKVPVVFLGYEDGSSNTQVLGGSTGIPVSGTTTLTGLTVSSTNATVSIGDATSSTEVIAANSSRKGWVLTNLSSSVCYVKLGSGASATSFHKRLAQFESCGQKLLDGDLYTGAIYAIWASDAGGTINGGDW